MDKELELKFSVPTLNLEEVPSHSPIIDSGGKKTIILTPKSKSRLKILEVRNSSKSNSMTNLPNYVPKSVERKKSENSISKHPHSESRVSKRRTLQPQDMEEIRNLRYSTDSESRKKHVKKTKSFTPEDPLSPTRRRKKKERKERKSVEVVEEEQVVSRDSAGLSKSAKKIVTTAGMRRYQNAILHNPKKLEGYRNYLEKLPIAIELLNFWLEIENYSILFNCTDSVMANDQAIKIFKYYSNTNNQNIHEKIHKQMNEQSNQILIENNLESNYSFLIERQQEAFDILFNEYFLNYWEVLYPNRKVKERSNSNSNSENNNNNDFEQEISKKKKIKKKRSDEDDVDDDDEEDEGNILLEFDEPNSEDNIRFATVNGKEVIVAASIAKLISRLTSVHNETNFNRIFFLTNKYFLSSENELLDLIVKKYKSVVLQKIDEKAKIEIINCICDVLKYWIIYSTDLFKRDVELLQKVYSFIENEIHANFSSQATNLRLQIDQQLNRSGRILSQVSSNPLKHSSHPDLVPKPKKLFKGGDLNNLQFEYIPTIELARQMTILDHSLFKSITPTEVLYQNWTKQSTKHLNSPNVLSMIKQFNRVGHWVISEIVSAKELKKRLEILTRMIQLTYECFKLKNFNSSMAMISGLKNSNVTRLKKTWELLSSNMWDMWEEMTAVLKIDNNFSRLRTEIKNAGHPALPYLGMFLSDITFNDAEPNFLDEEQKLVNFSKMRYLVDYIEKMNEYMAHIFYLELVPEIRHFLITLPVIHESKFYDESVLCEGKSQNPSVGLNSRSMSFTDIDIDKTAIRKMVRSLSMKRRNSVSRTKIESVFDKQDI